MSSIYISKYTHPNKTVDAHTKALEQQIEGKQNKIWRKKRRRNLQRKWTPNSLQNTHTHTHAPHTHVHVFKREFTYNYKCKTCWQTFGEHFRTFWALLVQFIVSKYVRMCICIRLTRILDCIWQRWQSHCWHFLCFFIVV